MEQLTVTAETRPFWDGCRGGQLRLPRCRDCRAWARPGAVICPACSGSDFAWEPASGDGEVYSFTVVHQHLAGAGRRPPLPYIVALVKLLEGPVIVSNIVGCAPDRVSIGQLVRVSFGDVGLDAPLPLFKPIESGEVVVPSRGF